MPVEYRLDGRFAKRLGPADDTGFSDYTPIVERGFDDYRALYSLLNRVGGIGGWRAMAQVRFASHDLLRRGADREIQTGHKGGEEKRPANGGDRRQQTFLVHG